MIEDWMLDKGIAIIRSWSRSWVYEDYDLIQSVSWLYFEQNANVNYHDLGIWGYEKWAFDNGEREKNRERERERERERDQMNHSSYFLLGNEAWSAGFKLVQSIEHKYL